MKSKRFIQSIVMCFLLIVPVSVLAAQDGGQLQLGLTRNFGYGGLGKIQGNFTLKITNPPADLMEVQFFIDGQLVDTVKAEPFLFKFHTSNFDEGEREMFAVGLFADGTAIESNHITKTFLSSSEAFGETQQLLGPLLIGAAVLTLLGVGVPLITGRSKEFVLGKYGPAGGVVCPRCQLPFSRSILSPNLVAGKLVRCPHCGKTSIQARASAGKLEEAETRFRRKDEPDLVQTGKADLRKQLEESRFEE